MWSLNANDVLFVVGLGKIRTSFGGLVISWIPVPRGLEINEVHVVLQFRSKVAINIELFGCV